MKIKINFELVIKTLLLFPILTVLQGLPYLVNLNRVFIGILFVEVFSLLKNMRYKPGDLLVIILTFALHIIAFYYTEGSLYNINMVFYLLLWVLLYLLISKKSSQLIDFFRFNKKYAMTIVGIWEVIVGISILFPSCYRDGAFMSFCDKPFRLMPTALVIMAILFIYQNMENSNKYYWYLIIPAYSAFMGFSRTYFGIFIMFLFIQLFYRVKDKRKLFFYGVPLVLICYFLMMRSNIGAKIIATLYNSNSHYDFWGTITSGRTVFWKLDINAFNKLPLWNKIVGNGYNFVFETNASHGYIWAHNDIINLIMNFGWLGVLVYLYAFYKMSRSLLKRNNYQIAKYGFLFIVFFNSNINMSYTYLCAFISYPLFLVSYAYIKGGGDINVHN